MNFSLSEIKSAFHKSNGDFNNFLSELSRREVVEVTDEDYGSLFGNSYTDLLTELDKIEC